MDINQVIDKIKKLQTLANNNTSINESYAATKAADKLIQEFRISAAQLEAAGTTKSESFTRKPVHIMKKRSSWRERIVSALCADYSACWYIMHMEGGETAYIVCAKESDAAVIQYMFSFCCAEGERLCSQASKGYGVGFAKSYLEGYSIGLAEQLKEARKAEKAAKETADNLMRAIGQNPGTSAMVLLDNRAIEARKYMSDFARGKAKSVRGSHSNLDGRDAGMSAGRSVRLNKGIGTSTSNKLIG